LSDVYILTKQLVPYFPFKHQYQTYTLVIPILVHSSIVLIERNQQFQKTHYIYFSFTESITSPFCSYHLNNEYIALKSNVETAKLN